MHCIHTLPRSSHRFPTACDSRKTPRSWCWSVTICWKWPGNLNRLTGNWGERENVGDFKDDFGMKSVKGGGFVAKIIKISNPGSPNLEVLAHPICFCPLGVWQYDQPVHLGVPFLWTKSCSQKIGIFRFMGSKMGFPAHGFEYCFNVPPNGGWSQWTWWLLVVGSEIGIYLPINCGFPLWMTRPYHIHPIFDHGIHGLSPQQKSMVADGCSRSKKRFILKGYALCRRPLDTGGSCLPLCRKHEMNPKETRNWPKQTICMCVWHCAHASSMDPCRMTRTTMCSDTFSWLKK